MGGKSSRLRLSAILLALVLTVFIHGFGNGDVISNGDFEGGSYSDGDDTVPNNWIKVETFSGGAGEISVISLVDDNGPSAPGSEAVNFLRTNGGASGDRTAIRQDMAILTQYYSKLELSLDVKAISHDLCGGGWAGAWEYPITVVIRCQDSVGTGKNAQVGWYLHTASGCDATDDWTW